MSVPRLSPHEVLPLVRRLACVPDPLALYAALTEGGRRPETLLLESADAHDAAGQRSLIVARSMLRLTCRDGAIEADALTANGEALRSALRLDLAARQLDPALPRERADLPDLDESARLLAPSPLDALRSAILGVRPIADAGSFAHVGAGIFGYDLVDRFESLPEPRADPDRFPDFVFWIPDRSVLIDHLHGACTVVALVAGGGDVEAAYHDAVRDVERLSRAVADVAERWGTPPAAARETAGRETAGRVAVDLSDEEFAGLVRRLQEHVAAGDVFQIVPSRTFTVGCADPLGAYARLRAANPTPYQYFIRSPEFVLFGASPEMAVRVGGEPRRVTIRPIAGTVRRARSGGGDLDAEMDARLQAALLTSPKDLAEHLMLVDLARNDVARVSRPGTRVVSRLLALEAYRHVTHLVSEVTGTLAEGLDALHAYAASLNMGTLVGAPKIEAARILRRYEPTRRGAYGGAVGILTHDGTLDTAIVIRSAIVRDGVASVRAGAGVVLDSDPAAEAEETRHKAAAVLEAVSG